MSRSLLYSLWRHIHQNTSQKWALLRQRIKKKKWILLCSYRTFDHATPNAPYSKYLFSLLWNQDKMFCNTEATCPRPLWMSLAEPGMDTDLLTPIHQDALLQIAHLFIQSQGWNTLAKCKRMTFLTIISVGMAFSPASSATSKFTDTE